MWVVDVERRRFLALLILAGCGRVGFDARSDATGGGDGPGDDVMLAPAQAWATTVGGSTTEPTWITDVVEDADGDVWVVGTSNHFGNDFTDGWVIKLDGVSGVFLAGGLRGFADPAQEDIEAALPVPGGVMIVGASYSASESQQQTLGTLAPDGAWTRSQRLGGSLLDPLPFESFRDVAATSDGGVVVAGYTRKGLGGCGTCDGLDSLVVRLDATGAIQWASSLGTQFGDESASAIVVLPGDDILVFGSLFGGYDYSGGAGTDVDSTPAIAYRLAADGSLVWTRELRIPNQRGGFIRDAVYDPSTGEVVIVGAMEYEATPFVAQLTTDGSVTRAFEVVVDDFPGVVSSAVIAPDGGLILAGHEEMGINAFTRYVARLTPTRDSVAWAIRAPFGFGTRDGGIIPSARGDFIAWASGASTMGNSAMVLRVGQDGTHAGCVASMAATITLRSLADNSTTFPGAPTSFSGAAWDMLVSETDPLPSSPPPVVTCVP